MLGWPQAAWHLELVGDPNGETPPNSTDEIPRRSVLADSRRKGRVSEVLTNARNSRGFPQLRTRTYGARASGPGAGVGVGVDVDNGARPFQGKALFIGVSMSRQGARQPTPRRRSTVRGSATRRPARTRKTATRSRSLLRRSRRRSRRRSVRQQACARVAQQTAAQCSSAPVGMFEVCPTADASTRASRA